MLVFFIALGLVGTVLLSIIYASLKDDAPGSAGSYQDDAQARTLRVDDFSIGDQVIWTDPVPIDGYQGMEWADVISVVTYDGEVWIRCESGSVLRVNACDLELNYNPTT